MNPTIELLLKRMESNPDEFQYNPSLGCNRWDMVYQDFEQALDEEDKQAYVNGLKKLRLNKFHEAVMKELLDPKLSTPSDTTQKTATLSGGQTHAQHTALHQQALQMQAQQAQRAYEAQMAQNQIKAQQRGLLGNGLRGIFGGSK